MIARSSKPSVWALCTAVLVLVFATQASAMWTDAPCSQLSAETVIASGQYLRFIDCVQGASTFTGSVTFRMANRTGILLERWRQTAGNLDVQPPAGAAHLADVTIIVRNSTIHTLNAAVAVEASGAVSRASVLIEGSSLHSGRSVAAIRARTLLNVSLEARDSTLASTTTTGDVAVLGHAAPALEKVDAHLDSVSIVAVNSTLSARPGGEVAALAGVAAAAAKESAYVLRNVSVSLVSSTVMTTSSGASVVACGGAALLLNSPSGDMTAQMAASGFLIELINSSLTCQASAGSAVGGLAAVCYSSSLDAQLFGVTIYTVNSTAKGSATESSTAGGIAFRAFNSVASNITTVQALHVNSTLEASASQAQSAGGIALRGRERSVNATLNQLQLLLRGTVARYLRGNAMASTIGGVALGARLDVVAFISSAIFHGHAVSVNTPTDRGNAASIFGIAGYGSYQAAYSGSIAVRNVSMGVYHSFVTLTENSATIAGVSVYTAGSLNVSGLLAAVVNSTVHVDGSFGAAVMGVVRSGGTGIVGVRGMHAVAVNATVSVSGCVTTVAGVSTASADAGSSVSELAVAVCEASLTSDGSWCSSPSRAVAGVRSLSQVLAAQGPVSVGLRNAELLRSATVTAVNCMAVGASAVAGLLLSGSKVDCHTVGWPSDSPIANGVGAASSFIANSANVPDGTAATLFPGLAVGAASTTNAGTLGTFAAAGTMCRDALAAMPTVSWDLPWGWSPRSAPPPRTETFTLLATRTLTMSATNTFTASASASAATETLSARTSSSTLSASPSLSTARSGSRSATPSRSERFSGTESKLPRLPTLSVSSTDSNRVDVTPPPATLPAASPAPSGPMPTTATAMATTAARPPQVTANASTPTAAVVTTTAAATMAPTPAPTLRKLIQAAGPGAASAAVMGEVVSAESASVLATSSQGAVVASSAIAASPATATKGANLANIMSVLECAYSAEDNDPSWMEVVFVWRLGTSPLAASLGSSLSVVLFLWLLLAVMLAAAGAGPRLRRPIGIFSSVAFAYFAPTVVGLTTTVIIHAESAGEQAAGICILVGCLAVVALPLGAVASAPAHELARAAERTPKQATVYMMLDLETWREAVLMCVSPLYDCARSVDTQAVRLVFFEDVLAAMAMASIAGVRPPSAAWCETVGACIVAVAALHWLYTVAFRPFVSTIEMVFALLISTAQLGMAAIAVVALRDGGWVPTLGWMAIAQTGLFLTQTLVVCIALLKERIVKRCTKTDVTAGKEVPFTGSDDAGVRVASTDTHDPSPFLAPLVGPPPATPLAHVRVAVNPLHSPTLPPTPPVAFDARAAARQQAIREMRAEVALLQAERDAREARAAQKQRAFDDEDL